jgi:RNA polymerase sigma factor (sigma-70 family)
MGRLATGLVIGQIEAVFDGSAVAGLDDRQLLERFVAGTDLVGEAAFAAMVARHGPMVERVCRQILGDAHDAEDAFQAVFFVLARRARSIRNPELLGNWLYGVSVKTARCARLQIDRRAKKEAEVAMDRPSPGSGMGADQCLLATEDLALVHQEIARLSDSFRLPVLLCYFDGLTLDEAARRLRWPAGTVRSRLARARDKLRRGLSRRGVMLSGSVVTSMLSSTQSASANISSAVCDATTKAAISFAARDGAGGAVSASAAAIALEVIQTMVIGKLKLIGLGVLALGAFATGAGYLTLALAAKNERRPLAKREEPRQAVKPPATPVQAPAGRMTVVGQVLDPKGKPVPGAFVDIMGRGRKPAVASREGVDPRVALGQGTTAAGGQFRLETMRTSWTDFFEVYAVAAAPGFGLGWTELNPDAGQPTAEIRLRFEQVIKGRLVDVNGQPAAGVELRIASVLIPNKEGSLIGANLGSDSPPSGLRAWPRPVITDKDGRFTLAGIGQNLAAGLLVNDRRFAQQFVRVQTDERGGEKNATLIAQPATIIEGHVLAADTGEAIANAVIEVSASRGELGSGYTTKFRADAQGRFTANPSPGDYFRVRAFPPQGQPYIVHEDRFGWTKGMVKKELDLKLPKGVLIRGKVTQDGTGRPIEGAIVQYLSRRNSDKIIDGWQAVVTSERDGSYQIAVAPRDGHLFVYGPDSGYILESIGELAVYEGHPGGPRYYAHDIISYEIKPGETTREINSTLRPGRTIKGRLVGPNGQIIEKAELITTLFFQYFHLQWRGDLTIHARDGSFELRGLDPDKTARVSILDADHEWGTTVELSGRQATDEMTIKLEPCGRASARFVGADGKPVAKISPHLEILGTPGPSKFTKDPKERAMLAADAAIVGNLDRKHYWTRPLTDADGRVVLPNLIPGALYRIADYSNPAKGVSVRKDFTVKSGEIVDLGEILIDKPRQ